MPKKILLADDSLTIQKVVELTFSDSDYELICVSNGERALEKVREDRPDLILADVVMPEKNGYEVCEAIKGNPATSRIPVVLLSGTFEPFDRSRAERIGADAIVSKPFDSQQLLGQVDALLAKVPAAPAAPAPSPIPQTTAAIAIPPPAAAVPAHSDDPPFDVGFSAEDFTAAVRLPPARTGIDPFEEEYGRGDVDSAIEAFEKAHPRFGFGSDLEADGALASQPLDRAPRLSPDQPERAEADDEPAVRAEEPVRREEPAPREPQWLREEPERTPFAPIREAPAPPLEFTGEDSIADEAATVAISRSQMPTIPNVRADELPTVEFPTVGFGREIAPADDRRSPLETADASFGGDEPRHEAAPFEKLAPASDSALALPSGGGAPREITATDAHLLFDVAPSAASEIHEPHPMPSAFGEPSVAEVDFGHAMEPHPLEESSFGAGASEAEEREAVRNLDPRDSAPASVSETRLGEASGEGEHEAPSSAVPGDIEMLAQRSSIPELTQMLSSMRSTGEITDEQLDRLAAKVVEKLSDKIVREIAWEVIPDMAEIVIRQRIKELEAGAE